MAEITKDMTFSQVLEKKGRPAAEVMMKYGLHCVGCHVAAFETVEQGSKAHGMSDKDLTKLLEELNKLKK